MLARMVKKFTPLRRMYYRSLIAKGIGGQSDEGQILLRLAKETGAPKNFIEFGFHPIQFNCAALMNSFDGFLIDANREQVADARAVLPSNIRIEERFLDLDNLDFIRKAFPKVGVLSIDIDGNDYWFLEKLLNIEPSVISIEYNPSFLDRSISVAYDPVFDRHQKHSTGWYHGASLAAMAKLCATKGYGLAAVSNGGVNAFFTKTGKLDPKTAWRPSELRAKWSGTKPQQQWEAVKHLPFVEI
ncbi:hypothetical protein OHD62_17270 [Mesorhizobium sp. YC-39]|uniref:hypothetical protein n=1 Tax=unclassified Mesorhizobium TaxID=325217 RepID=UPI0021E8E537|nr:MULTISPECIES: hypothetical protein [unclassified Mesorhizobium]MCV3209594.1 hypothetical protein [Mesorhizobium sp. YC-2]MCV3230124.1 hypothetical protein [Mesorhizobium sp. YC-39]